MFHEWDNQQTDLTEIFRVLKPGGSVILRDCNRVWLSSWKASVLGLFHHVEMFRFTVDDVAGLWREAGFDQIRGQGSGMKLSVQAIRPQQSGR